MSFLQRISFKYFKYNATERQTIRNVQRHHGVYPVILFGSICVMLSFLQLIQYCICLRTGDTQSSLQRADARAASYHAQVLFLLICTRSWDFHSA